MSGSRGRAFRREKAAKAVVRAREILCRRHDDDVDSLLLDELASKLADNLANCSCPLCGNPRKWDKELSVQERRSEIAIHE